MNVSYCSHLRYLESDLAAIMGMYWLYVSIYKITMLVIWLEPEGSLYTHQVSQVWNLSEIPGVSVKVK